LILPLVYYGNAILRTRSKEVLEINTEIKQLIADMVETMDSNNGVGLAAIQVGKPLRIFIVRPLLEKENTETYLGEVEVYINPKILKITSETDIMSEGCLSLPQLHSDVERPIAIQIEALDINGKKISKKLEGFHARELMHENDHLNGVLFIDRLTAKKRKEVEPQLKEIKEKYN